MRSGSQRVKIAIWRNVQTGATDMGERRNVPQLWKETWAEMVARRGSEHLQDDQIFALTHFFFTCRHLSVAGIDPTMWIMVDGQKYRIRNIMPDMQKKDRTVIEAQVENINIPQGNAGSFALAIALETDAPGGEVGAAYAGLTPSVTGGVAPYGFTVPTGSLPAGLSINATTGAVTGTPSAPGTSSFTIRVTDAAGTISELPLTIEVEA